MKIKILWHPPIPLKDGSAEDLIYMVGQDEIAVWDGYPGVYMFCRQYGESVIPMYIGRSKNLYNRIWEHLETTTLRVWLFGIHCNVTGELGLKA